MAYLKYYLARGGDKETHETRMPRQPVAWPILLSYLFTGLFNCILSTVPLIASNDRGITNDEFGRMRSWQILRC